MHRAQEYPAFTFGVDHAAIVHRSEDREGLLWQRHNVLFLAQVFGFADHVAPVLADEVDLFPAHERQLTRPTGEQRQKA
ncbi:hypothetical protein D3C75_1086750 [compost metagenome]